ncbi:hypothetical protein EDD18DRAFT_1355871 [Armillaria luteobubalina]|uniref:Uncharacterized protein n=1 Tax=Armillaria luteobubalina TaxID=153913 RepID=A0AA39Q356_9AGAR|nr:hypothetical protein EDD18DRAFT_1355871 [Armillaria luteobubalina]
MSYPQLQNHIIKDLTSLIQYLDDDHVICPNCDQHVGLGPGGLLNLRDRHISSKKCLDAAQAQDTIPKKIQSLLVGFLQPRLKLVMLTVSTPSVLQPMGIATNLKPSLVSKTAPANRATTLQVTEHEMSVSRPLNELEALLPDVLPITTDSLLNPNTGLSIFPSNPLVLDDPSIARNNLWEEVLNNVIHQAFWGKDTSQLVNMVQTESSGMHNFCRFVHYFTDKCGVDP